MGNRLYAENLAQPIQVAFAMHVPRSLARAEVVLDLLRVPASGLAGLRTCN